MYMYKQELELNNIERLICRKTQPTNETSVGFDNYVHHKTPSLSLLSHTHLHTLSLSFYLSLYFSLSITLSCF